MKPLTVVLEKLTALTDWRAAAIHDIVNLAAAELQLGLGKVAQPLRAALTGRTTSPGIFDVLWLLGRDESLARVADRLQPAAV